MDPNFIRDVQKSHLAECQEYYGPKFIWNVQAIVAYGEVILLVGGKPEYGVTMLRRFHDGEGGAIPGGEESGYAMVDRGARLLLETLNKSEQALTKLYSNTRQLADARGPIAKLANLIHDANRGAIMDDIVSAQEGVAILLASARQEVKTLETLWATLRSFLQRATRAIEEKMLELANAVNNMTTCHQNSKQLSQMKNLTLKDFQSQLSQQEQIMKANAPGWWWGPQPVYLAAVDQASHLRLKVANSEQEWNQARAAAEKSKTDRAALANTSCMLETLISPLKKALATVDTTLSAYSSLLERLIETDTKEKDLARYLQRIKEPRNLNQEEVEFARVYAFQMIVEMRLTFSIFCEWSSLYVRVSRELLLPAFHEIYGGGNFNVVLENLAHSDMPNFRKRVQQSVGILPVYGVPLASRGGRIQAVEEGDALSYEIYTGSLNNGSQGMKYLKQISKFAELEVEKLYNNEQQHAVDRANATVESIYVSTVRATSKEFRTVQAAIDRDMYETMPVRRGVFRRQELPAGEGIAVGTAVGATECASQQTLPRKKRGLLGFR